MSADRLAELLRVYDRVYDRTLSILRGGVK
jgi:hypothetical protein